MSSEEYMSLYVILGREAGIRRLVNRFYDVMDTEEIAKGIRAMHPDSLEMSREKTALFLIGWSGGPNVYVERYGHPRLRARHLPFPIDTAAKEAWMYCMRTALREMISDRYICQQIEENFDRIADHMRNHSD